MTIKPMQFQPGVVVVSLGLSEFARTSGIPLAPLLYRHLRADYGTASAETCESNRFAIEKQQGQVVSFYPVQGLEGDFVMVMTNMRTRCTEIRFASDEEGSCCA